MIGVWQFFLTRGSKCTNQRKTILIACFLRGHLNIIQWGKIWISFDPKCFKAAGRSSLEKIWRPCYEERCQYNVEVCFHALNLQMHILFAVGSNWKMTLSDFGMGWSANSKKNKRNCQDIQWRQILHRRNDKSEYQECTSKMDKTLKRGMCIKFESRKICIAGNQCDISDLNIHNAEDKKLPVFI